MKTPSPQEAAKHYVLETISDFWKIPDDKLEKCLNEFRGAMLAARATARMIEATGDAMGTPVEVPGPPRVEWIDDDGNKLTINLKTPELRRTVWRKKSNTPKKRFGP